jgi:hypothetical protein
MGWRYITHALVLLMVIHLEYTRRLIVQRMFDSAFTFRIHMFTECQQETRLAWNCENNCTISCWSLSYLSVSVRFIECHFALHIVKGNAYPSQGNFTALVYTRVQL